MSDHIFALLVHEKPEPFESLRRALRDLSVETFSVGSVKEAAHLIEDCKPHMIFTESSLTDGSWLSILNTAEAADVPLSVIVVDTVPNTRYYISITEQGAFDFVVPPFEHEALSFIVRSAALNTFKCREASARAAVCQ
jgi:DNA-binding NtrC family response regulator